MSDPVKAPTGERLRTTIYLDPEDLASLDEVKAYFRRHHGRRVDRSQAIREAIRYLHRGLVASAWGAGEEMHR